MKIIASLLIALFSTLFFNHKSSNPPPYKNITKEFNLRWKSQIGNASFRTNLYADKNYLVIGSNGSNFMDMGLVDMKSGIYILDARSGRIVCSLNKKMWGDFDVNGVLVYNNKIYFGNDNEEFMCVDFAGQLLWKNVASGDVEAEPVIIDINNKKAIIYASELGEVRAVDPTTGKYIWSFYTDDFNGWKEGDSRKIFKVKAFLSNSRSFFAKPAVGDMNNDGVKDLTYVGYNNVVYCLNGVDGSLLWELEHDQFYFGYNLEYHNEFGSPEVWLSSYGRKAGLDESESSISRINSKGELFTSISLQKDDGYSFSLNSFSLSDSTHLYATNDSIYLIENGKVSKGLYFSQAYKYKYPWNNEEREDVGDRNFSGLLFGSSFFSYKETDSCIVILSQRDHANYSLGFVSIVSLKDWKVLNRLSIPSASEMPPQVIDIDNDGNKELLLNCFDGNLYCYRL